MTTVTSIRVWTVRAVLIATMVSVALGLSGADVVTAGGAMEGLKKSGTIQVGWATFKPMIYIDTETRSVAGMWAELTQAMVTEGLGLKLSWVEATWPTIVTGIQARRWDLATAAITDARSAIAQPTKPFVKVDYTALLKSGSPVATWKDLDQPGKRISVSQGSSTDQVLTAVLKHATIVRVRQEQALLELLSGKVDAQAATRDYAIQTAKTYPGYRVLPDAFGETSIAWYVDKEADDLRAAVERWLEGAKKRGFIKQLIDKWHLEGADPA